MVLAIVLALLLLGAVAVVPVALALRGKGSGDSSATSAPRNLDAVREYDDLDPSHVPLGEAVDYPQSPPVGGSHWPAWLECGVYDQPVPVEGVVHDLEHGTVWITYRADLLDGDDVDRLAERLPSNGILSPYPDQEAPVVITVWGRQLHLVGPDDPRIDLFVAEYGAGGTAPEPYASCHGGVRPDDLAPRDQQAA